MTIRNSHRFKKSQQRDSLNLGSTNAALM